MKPLNLRSVAIACILFFTSTHSSFAQTPKYSADKTLLELDLVLPVGLSSPLLAQRWRQDFEAIGESVRIRQFVTEDRPALTEKGRGPFRIVKAVGLIDLDGKLTFPNRSFSPGQPAELKNWIQEIKMYGAQGSPAGMPRWGLTDAQYQELLSQLSTPTTESVRGRTLQAALATLPLPATLPLVPHDTLEVAWKEAQSSMILDETQGLATGTSLAYLLSQQGFSFRPERLPDGKIQLMVVSSAEISEHWPIGKSADNGRPRNELFPELFTTFEMGIQKSPLTDVLDAIEERSGVRLLIDRQAAITKGLNPDEILVAYPVKKRTAWSLILSAVITNAHMSMSYQQDDAGKGFIWIVPFAHYTPPTRPMTPTQPKP